VTDGKWDWKRDWNRPGIEEYQQTYLSVTLDEKNPEGRIEKPH